MSGLDSLTCRHRRELEVTHVFAPKSVDRAQDRDVDGAELTDCMSNLTASQLISFKERDIQSRINEIHYKRLVRAITDFQQRMPGHILVVAIIP